MVVVLQNVHELYAFLFFSRVYDKMVYNSR